MISDVVLVLNEQAEPRQEALALAIGGGKILEICPAAQMRTRQRQQKAAELNQRIVEVGRRPIVPSFVNGHTHLSMAPLRGIASHAARLGNVVSDVFFQLEQHLTPEDVYAFTKLGAYESLFHGVGEVWDHYYHGKEVARALLQVGLTGKVAPTLQDISGPGVYDWESQLAATEEIATSDTFRLAGIDAALGPHASDSVSEPLMKEVASSASRLNLPVHLHLAQSIDEYRVGRNKSKTPLALRVLERLEDSSVLMAHGLYLSEEECRQLVQAKWVLAFCPYSQLQFGFLSPLSTWVRVGGQWVLGTDCVASNDALDVQRELPLAGGFAALEVSFSAQRAKFLQDGSSVGANSLDNHRRSLLGGENLSVPSSLLHSAWGLPLKKQSHEACGGISVGAQANLMVLLSEHPSLFPHDSLARTLAYGATSSAIDFMVVGGRIIGEKCGLQREILESEEYLDTLNEVRSRRDELFDRAQISRALGSTADDSCQSVRTRTL